MFCGDDAGAAREIFEAAPHHFGFANFFEKPNRRTRPELCKVLHAMAAHGEKWQPENRERGGREIKSRVEDERAEQNHGCSIVPKGG